jgi:signal transduction histidine kinase
MSQSRFKRFLQVFGPFPFNPTLIFSFFFAFYFSRFVPILIEQPQGLERWKFAAIILFFACLPSLGFAGSAYLLQRYRRWSNSNFFYYLIEVAVAESTIFICNPIIVAILGPRYQAHFQAPLTLTPGLYFGSLALAICVLALLHKAEKSVFERLSKADELVRRLESDREELIKSDEELRRQTSQFLHDRVQSDLMVVAMKLKGIQGKSSSEIDTVITKAIARLESTRTSDLRNLVQILTPNFEGSGLEEVLHLLADQYNSSISVAFEISDEVNSLSENQQLGIFRISEQALLNSLVHGPASSVRISISLVSHKLVKLSIVDDGPGVDLTEAKPGVGTAIIDSWVSMLKGKRELISQPGQGYRLEVEFPR